MNTAATLAAIFGPPALLALYILECWLWPYEKCPHCSGSGKRYSPAGEHWGLCRHCNGTSRRMRLGRRMWNRWQESRR